jgi:predicted acylesterase/phospholipase RssA
MAKDKDHCHALALGGGGNNGAWEAGVIWGLMNYGNPKDYEWDVLTGISVGSINSSYLSAWEPKDGLKAA